MFKRLARFRLVRSRRLAPGLREVMPANDNLPGFRRPGGQHRIPSLALVCHWSLIEGGTRLGCHWQPESPAETSLEGSDSGRTNNQTSKSEANWLGRRRNLPGVVLTVGA